jgi:hypothetical protein
MGGIQKTCAPKYPNKMTAKPEKPEQGASRHGARHGARRKTYAKQESRSKKEQDTVQDARHELL